MAAGNQWKHLEFTLALSKCFFSHRHFSQHKGYSELENIRQIDIFVYIRRIDIFVHVICYPETMPTSRTSRIVENSVFYFQNKVGYQAEDRPADICLKLTST